MKQIICVGSGSKDVLFPTSDIRIIDNSQDIEAKKLMAFEFGAKIKIEDRFEAPGGCAVNVSQGLARLGIAPACCCCLGNDDEGKWVLNNLAKEKVDTVLIQTNEKCKTDLAFILINESDGDRTIFFNRDANEKLEVKGENLETEWLFVSALYGRWKENVDAILQKVREKKINLAYNPGQANLKEGKNKFLEMIKEAEILIVNKDEAIEIVGQKKDDDFFLLKELRKLGAKLVVMTDGANGSHAFDGNKILKAFVTKEKPKDLTGAGDAFSSGFMASFLKGNDLKECLRWGIANGGNSVNFYGAKDGLLGEEKIKEKAKTVEIRFFKVS